MQQQKRKCERIIKNRKDNKSSLSSSPSPRGQTFKEHMTLVFPENRRDATSN